MKEGVEESKKDAEMRLRQWCTKNSWYPEVYGTLPDWWKEMCKGVKPYDTSELVKTVKISRDPKKTVTGKVAVEKNEKYFKDVFLGNTKEGNKYAFVFSTSNSMGYEGALNLYFKDYYGISLPSVLLTDDPADFSYYKHGKDIKQLPRNPIINYSYMNKANSTLKAPEYAYGYGELTPEVFIYTGKWKVLKNVKRDETIDTIAELRSKGISPHQYIDIPENIINKLKQGRIKYLQERMRWVIKGSTMDL